MSYEKNQWFLNPSWQLFSSQRDHIYTGSVNFFLSIKWNLKETEWQRSTFSIPPSCKGYKIHRNNTTPKPPLSLICSLFKICFCSTTDERYVLMSSSLDNTLPVCLMLHETVKGKGWALNRSEALYKSFSILKVKRKSRRDRSLLEHHLDSGDPSAFS